MPKEPTQHRRIEAVFESTGLGNLDPEKIVEFLEAYERTMITADRVSKRKGKKFTEVLASTAKEAAKEGKEDKKS